MMNFLRYTHVLTASVYALALAANVATAQNCDNAIPATGTQGPAETYPMTRTYSNVSGTVQGLLVAVNNMNHTYPQDLVMLLEGPTGQTCLLMAGCGGTNDLVRKPLIFDQGAGPLPENDPISATTYRPTVFNFSGSLPSPAPQGPYGTSLSSFVGLTAQGTWKLWVYDQSTNDVGCLDDFAIGVLQQGATCSLSATPVGVFSARSGANLSFSISLSSQACQWELQSLPDWIFVNGATSGLGNASFSGFAEVNTSPFPRLGQFFYNGRPAFVLQGGAPLQFTQTLDDQMNVSVLQPPGSTTGWSSLGMNTAGLAGPGLTGTAIEGVISAHPTKQRTAGAIQNKTSWLAFSTMGAPNVARGKFSIYGNAGGSPDIFLMPNLRLRMAARFAANSMLEVFHYNADNATQNAMDAELRPSADAAVPSRYTVDIKVPAVPATSTAGEGIQAGFEAFAQLPQTLGAIGLTELEVGHYANDLLFNGNTPQYIYQPSGTGAGNLQAYNPAAEVDLRNLIAGASEGDPAVTDGAAPSGQLPTTTAGTTGVTLSTISVPTTRIGVAVRNFNPGLGGTNYTQRFRVDEGRQYTARFQLTSTQNANVQPQIRMRMRSIKFAWTQKFEIGGAEASGSLSNTLAKEMLPGVGSQNPDNLVGENGGFYTLLMTTPMSKDIRPNIVNSLPLTARMPNITGQPGNGADAASRRDIFVSLDMLDTISGGANRALEQGHVLLGSILLRSYDTVPE